MKKVVVVTKDGERIVFEASGDYLDVYNKDTGELVVSDVKEKIVEDRLKRPIRKTEAKIVAVFKEWSHWKEVK